MKLILKIGLFLILLLGVGGYLLFRSFQTELAGYATAAVSQEAARQNVFLNFSQPNFGLFNFSSKLLELELPQGKMPMRVELQNILIAPSFLSLFSDRKTCWFEFQALGGKISGNLLLEGNSIGLQDVRIKDLQIYQLSSLGLLGLKSGKLDLELEQLLLTSALPAVRNLKFEISNLVKSELSMIPTWMSGLPFNLTIQPLTIEKWSGLVNVDQLLELTDVDWRSSWGNLNGELSLEKLGSKLLMKAAQGKVTLSDTGKKQFGDFLPLISSQQLAATTQNFSLEFKDYQGNFPRFNFTPE